jgi:anti-sigma B factor antagonist
MTSDTDPKNAATVLRIEGELTIFRALELKPALLGTGLREIDLSGVTELDTAGVQLLMLAKKTAQSAGRELRLVAHSPAVIEVFELLNVAAYFDDPLVMATRTGADRSAKATSARNSHGS